MDNRFDYYAGYPGQQATPKWIGVALGSLFGVILLVGVGVCVHLLAPTRSAQASTATPAPQPTASNPIVAPPAAEPAQVAVADEAPAHVSRKHGHAAKHGKVMKGHAAMAKVQPAKYKKAQLYAKGVSRKDKKARDDIDKMLGL